MGKSIRVHVLCVCRFVLGQCHGIRSKIDFLNVINMFARTSSRATSIPQYYMLRLLARVLPKSCRKIFKYSCWPKEMSIHIDLMGNLQEFCLTPLMSPRKKTETRNGNKRKGRML